MSRHDNLVTAVVHETAVVIGGSLNTGTRRGPVADGHELITFLKNRRGPNLSRRLDPSLHRFARSLAPSLGGAQLDLDVVQQMWLDLLLRVDRIDPLKSGSGFARWMIRSYALREVLSSCVLLGCKKRPTKKDREQQVVPISLEDMHDKGIDPPEIAVGEDVMIARIEAHELLRLAASTAPSFVSLALALIYLEGLPFTEAASCAGVTHVKLRRGIDRWAAERDLSGLSEPKAVTVMGQSASQEQRAPRRRAREALRYVA